MISKFLRRYFNIIFVLATLMGVFHHHNELKQYNDCQICIVQSNLDHVDTPDVVQYLTKLELFSESVVTLSTIPHVESVHNYLKARAPPQIS
ncbi:MAG: hypothetical protein QM497_11095 [Sulfurimonas sp.]